MGGEGNRERGRLTPDPRHPFANRDTGDSEAHGEPPRFSTRIGAMNRTGQHRTTSKYHSWAFDVGCWMFTWALNVECRKLNVDEHSTLNIQRSTPKAPLNPVSWTTLPHPSNPQFTLQLLIDDARRDDVGGDV